VLRNYLKRTKNGHSIFNTNEGVLNLKFPVKGTESRFFKNKSRFWKFRSRFFKNSVRFSLKRSRFFNWEGIAFKKSYANVKWRAISFRMKGSVMLFPIKGIFGMYPRTLPQLKALFLKSSALFTQTCALFKELCALLTKTEALF
jgi:hypothetical protein